MERYWMVLNKEVQFKEELCSDVMYLDVILERYCLERYFMNRHFGII